MDSRAERVLVAVDVPLTGLHCLRDDQVSLDGIVQDGQRGGRCPAPYESGSKPHQICCAQRGQRTPGTFPTLDGRHIEVELFGQAGLGEPGRLPNQFE